MKNLSILSILAICFLTLACGDESDSDTGANSTSRLKVALLAELPKVVLLAKLPKVVLLAKLPKVVLLVKLPKVVLLVKLPKVALLATLHQIELWNAVCADDSDCAAPINLCSKAPAQQRVLF